MLQIVTDVFLFICSKIMIGKVVKYGAGEVTEKCLLVLDLDHASVSLLTKPTNTGML